jgi:hypothetical protein
MTPDNFEPLHRCTRCHTVGPDGMAIGTGWACDECQYAVRQYAVALSDACGTYSVSVGELLAAVTA